VDEGSLGVHKIELVVKSGEDFSNSGRVGNHAASSHDLSEITTWNNGRRLIVDTDLETSWAPVNELDGSLGLDGSNGSVDILGDDITSVHHGAGHVFTMSGVTLSHHVSGLKSGVGDFSDGELFVVSLLSGDNGSVRWKHKVNSGVRNEIGLELSDINVEGTIESQRSSERRDNLSDESVQVSVSWSFDVEVSSADIVKSFIVEHDGDISVLKKRMGGKNGVVGLNDSSGDLRRRIDSETKFGFFAVIDGESLEKKRTKTWTSTTTNGVEDQETLETSAVISELSDSVQAKIDDFLADGVVTSCEVVSGILLTGDELFRVEELSVSTSSDFINNCRFKIQEDRSWNVFTSTSFREKCVECIISSSNGLVRWHLTIRLDTMLKAE
jgi:hypothetical protein